MIFLFLFFLIQTDIYLVLSLTTEIRFNLNNVPTLFRCKRNGPIIRFEQFPTAEQFSDVIGNLSGGCDLSLSSNENRVVLDVEKLELHCYLKKSELSNHVTELLFFTPKCPSINLCIRLVPPVVTIITEYKTQPNNPSQFNLEVHGIGTNSISIGDKNENWYSWKGDVYRKGGYRTNQIVFKHDHKKVLNMMCEYTYVNNPTLIKRVCRRKYLVFKNSIEMRKGQMTSLGTGWSWICYYYPAGAEDPMDYKMVKRATDDFERAHSLTPGQVALRAPMELMDVSENVSSPLNSPNSEPSNFPAPVWLFFLVIPIVGVVCCVYKQKSKKELPVEPNAARSVVRSRSNSLSSNKSLTDIDS